ncbi:MAG: low molecular weight phosphotyrosine protein phosphatase [Gammaproteobacteria bacterium]|jgi:protein-tyrosine phosphatase|nr:low molecular weight phosphotyrosine protein phosphatase [Gammaproteobacteria bacterium]
MNNRKPIKVLFVCMGNICRSPSAEGVFHKLVDDLKLSSEIEIDSAGTHAYHVGESPDRRAQATALSREVDLSNLSARLFIPADFQDFDYILAMDEQNYRHMQAQNPRDGKAELSLFLEFASKHSETEVPDPYYGGNQGFERVFTMIQDASEGLLEHIRKQHDL